MATFAESKNTKMLSIHAFIFNPFAENTYIVADEKGQCIIIDAGNYSAREDRQIAEYIDSKGLKPTMLVNTHGHVDHLLGAAFLKEMYGIPLAVHSADNFLVESAPEHGRIYGFNMRAVPGAELDLSQMDGVEIGSHKLDIIHTPGHTPGHVCLFDREGQRLFTGDTLFRESIGRTDLPGGDYSWIMRSILDRILPLGPGVQIFTGHGPNSDIGHETLYNPFITEVIGGEVNP